MKKPSAPEKWLLDKKGLPKIIPFAWKDTAHQKSLTRVQLDQILRLLEPSLSYWIKYFWGNVIRDMSRLPHFRKKRHWLGGYKFILKNCISRPHRYPSLVFWKFSYHCHPNQRSPLPRNIPLQGFTRGETSLEKFPLYIFRVRISTGRYTRYCTKHIVREICTRWVHISRTICLGL